MCTLSRLRMTVGRPHWSLHRLRRLATCLNERPVNNHFEQSVHSRSASVPYRDIIRTVKYDDTCTLQFAKARDSVFRQWGKLLTCKGYHGPAYQGYRSGSQYEFDLCVELNGRPKQSLYEILGEEDNIKRYVNITGADLRAVEIKPGDAIHFEISQTPNKFCSKLFQIEHLHILREILSDPIKQAPPAEPVATGLILDGTLAEFEKVVSIVSSAAASVLTDQSLQQEIRIFKYPLYLVHVKFANPFVEIRNLKRDLEEIKSMLHSIADDLKELKAKQ